MKSSQASKPKQKGKPHRHTVAQVADALRDANGAIAVAAKSLGLNRSTLWRRVSKNEMLSEIVTDGREALIDEAESQLRIAVEKGASWAVALTLRTIGRHRGYVERVETDDRSPAPPNPWEGKTDDEIKEAIREAINYFFPNGLD